jgi:hypothetical protein
MKNTKTRCEDSSHADIRFNGFRIGKTRTEFDDVYHESQRGARTRTLGPPMIDSPTVLNSRLTIENRKRLGSGPAKLAAEYGARQANTGQRPVSII